MSSYLDKLKRNLSVLQAEWKLWRDQMKAGVKRFNNATLDPGSKSNVFHLVTNLIEETYDSLPRTLTYLTLGFFVGWLIGRVVALF